MRSPPREAYITRGQTGVGRRSDHGLTPRAIGSRIRGSGFHRQARRSTIDGIRELAGEWGASPTFAWLAHRVLLPRSRPAGTTARAGQALEYAGGYARHEPSLSSKIGRAHV